MRKEPRACGGVLQIETLKALHAQQQEKLLQLLSKKLGGEDPLTELADFESGGVDEDNLSRVVTDGEVSITMHGKRAIKASGVRHAPFALRTHGTLCASQAPFLTPSQTSPKRPVSPVSLARLERTSSRRSNSRGANVRPSIATLHAVSDASQWVEDAYLDESMWDAVLLIGTEPIEQLSSLLLVFLGAANLTIQSLFIIILFIILFIIVIAVIIIVIIIIIIIIIRFEYL